MSGLCNLSTYVLNRAPIKFNLICFLLIGFISGCDSNKIEKEPGQTTSSPYLNHSDTAHYVGMQTCRSCHQAIYNTYVETGMGNSFGIATKYKSSAQFSDKPIYDQTSNYFYQAFWLRDSLAIKEFRLNGRDTSHTRIEQVNFIIGSGQHTNSHLQITNGFVNQMPMTYYTQKKHWDLPPGFEKGFNTRFSRKIGIECMSCHNAYPDFVLGSENKYTRIPQGIDCERCHGPGSIHAAQKSAGKLVDTSRYIDYSIVNPAKLSIDAQFDICQRCHLQGNAVLKEGKTFFDFLPGQKLSDYMSVFLPKYKNADDQFIMASHADRLKQSACFIKSYEQSTHKTTLKPFKDALTCVTCHNPHVSVRKTNSNVFNDACLKCHSANSKEKNKVLEKTHQSFKQGSWSDCVSCHMPLSGATDIPHVTVHDHYIRKPITKREKEKIKSFLGLFSVNEKNPDILTKANAYINQYEKFDQDPAYLDSATLLLQKNKDVFKNKYALLQLYFLKGDHKNILNLLKSLNEKRCYDSVFIHQSFDNRNAWAAYRIGDAYLTSGNKQKSQQWYKRAVDLAPYDLDFRNKYASGLAGIQKLEEARKEFLYILQQDPKMVSAYTNLGYIRLIQGFANEAKNLYDKAEKLDPDNEALLLNLAGYYLYLKQSAMALTYIKRVLKINPANQIALTAFKQINAYE
jgi:tetratricopeptide (TPR) repeat protein